MVLRSIDGALVRMDRAVTPDSATAGQVQRMEAGLEADPTYAPRF